MVRNERVEYLEGLLPESETVYEKKYKKVFDTQAMYMGNGVYKWAGVYARDTRELWLMGVLGMEGIEYEEI